MIKVQYQDIQIAGTAHVQNTSWVTIIAVGLSYQHDIKIE